MSHASSRSSSLVAVLFWGTLAVGCGSSSGEKGYYGPGSGPNPNGSSSSSGSSGSAGSTGSTGSTGRSGSTGSTGSGGSGGSPGLSRIAYNGGEYLVHAPPSYDGQTPLPMVWAFHGSGGNKDGTLNAWVGLANQAGFLVGAMQSSDPAGWALPPDATTFVGIVNDAEARYNVDTKRRYLWGMSAGGAAVHYIGLAYADSFASYAANAGLIPTGIIDPAMAVRKIPVSLFVGTSDPALNQVRQDKALLENNGFPVRHHEFRGGHVPGDRNQAWSDMSAHALP